LNQRQATFDLIRNKEPVAWDPYRNDNEALAVSPTYNAIALLDRKGTYLPLRNKANLGNLHLKQATPNAHEPVTLDKIVRGPGAVNGAVISFSKCGLALFVLTNYVCPFCTLLIQANMDILYLEEDDTGAGRQV